MVHSQVAHHRHRPGRAGRCAEASELARGDSRPLHTGRKASGPDHRSLLWPGEAARPRSLCSSTDDRAVMRSHIELCLFLGLFVAMP
jgi:hypothetical protein